ncbi:MAG: DUF262 domain-containing protein [Deltaproteobacteria bacterium]|nr:DUF262 domain-containing protein [Deltaproteobacteria bacterium]
MSKLLGESKTLDAAVFSVEELLKKVTQGKLRMPHFQRSLLWKASDVELLFDSLLNGFPIGVLLFWEKGAPADRQFWGPWVQSVEADPRAWFVIDGQHRVASLALTLLAPEDGLWGADQRFALYWDVRTREFARHTGRGAEPPAHWLPMHCVGDMVRLMDWGDAFRSAGGTKEEVESARRFARTILDYKLNTFVVQTDSEDVARAIYERTNTTGQKMSPDEVFKGLHGGAIGGTDALVEGAAHVARELGFAELDHNWVLKSLLAVADKDLTHIRSSVQELESTAVQQSLPQVVQALTRALTFLRDDCDIIAAPLLPYDLPVAYLTRFFHRFPQPSARSLRLLRRWFWRGCAHGVFAAGDRSRVRAMSAAVEGDEEASVQRLLEQVPKQRVAIGLDSLSPRRKNNRVGLTVLAAAGPRDLRDGTRLDIAALFADLGTGACDGRIETDKDLAGTLHGSLANRLIQPRLSRQTRNHLLCTWTNEARQGDASAHAVLASHFLTPDDFVPLTSDEGAAVLRNRAERITSAVSGFIDARAEWDQSDRPSIAWLLREAERTEAA